MTRALALLMCATLTPVMIASAADLPSALVDPYLQVQTALAGDQMSGLQAHAQAIATAALALGKDAEAIGASAKKLGASKDLAAARAAFGELSTAIETYAGRTGAGFGAGVRLAYCPMADKPWLQKDKEIRNPYYGASMLTCGNFKK
ncbi:MAG: hypothetical protein ACT4QD_25770 [Acidobacteriota bacterium]